MPIAAVPQYLGQDFSAASPGLRFGMYLKLWGINQRSKELLWVTHDVDYKEAGPRHEEREVKPENKVSALKDATSLNSNDKAVMKAQLARQSHAFSKLPETGRLALDAQAIAPFTTGLGNEHPLENGFAFLNPYGLPYLPGSGVKGVLRQAARELVSGEWGETQGWTDDVITALFGRQGQDGDTDHLRGALTFWDVIPQIKGDRLSVEIMTPHQTHYYQNGESPHDSGSPNPISFLTVPPDSGFTFHVQCDLALLARTAPELVENEQWKKLLQAAFTHAFDWLGFGAKTAVGYGHLADIAALEQQKETKRAQLQIKNEEKIIAALKEAGIAMGSETWHDAVLKDLKPGSGEVTVASPTGGRTSGKIYNTLSESAKNRLKKGKTVPVEVKIERQGNMIAIKSIKELV